MQETLCPRAVLPACHRGANRPWEAIPRGVSALPHRIPLSCRASSKPAPPQKYFVNGALRLSDPPEFYQYPAPAGHSLKDAIGIPPIHFGDTSD